MDNSRKNDLSPIRRAAGGLRILSLSSIAQKSVFAVAPIAGAMGYMLTPSPMAFVGWIIRLLEENSPGNSGLSPQRRAEISGSPFHSALLARL